MRRFVFVLSAVVIGLALGAWSAWFATGAFARGAAIEVNGWRGSMLAGSDAADPYTRAAIARHGLLALPAERAFYLSRDTDAAGARLTDGCTYRISGERLPAQWWSLTLYDETGFLARNEDGAHSIDATRTQSGADGRWEAFIGPVRAPGPWISNTGSGAFSVLLRLYAATPAALSAPEAIPVPQIERIACLQEGAA